VSKPSFVRYGRTRHLRIATAEDLRQILTLTRTRWIATAAPVSAFDLDPEFLARLDADRDGRILPHELRGAIQWTLEVLSSYEGLETGREILDPLTINGLHPDGERVAHALEIPRRLSRTAAEQSGEEAAEEPGARQSGAEPPGEPASPAAVTRAELHAAMAELTRWSADEERAGRPPEALTAVQAKIEEFFFLSRAVAASGKAAPYEESLAAVLATFEAAAVRAALEGLPLAPPTPAGVLPLVVGVNPVYEGAIVRFRAEIVEPVLGRREQLDETEWRAILERYAPAAISGRYAEDIAALELAARLAVFQKELMRFANSFVACPHLYHPDRHAAFEAGTLYLGGYAFTFAVKVPDRAFHVEVARSSNIFVLYAAVYADGPPVYEIAVPVTSGTGRRLFRGKHGVFLDTRGQEWHARIVEIVTNPVSLMEAVLRPFRRLGEVLSGRIEAITREAEASLDRTAAGVIPGPGAGSAPGAPALVAPPQASAAAAPLGARAGFMGNAGMLAGAGLALAAVTSAFAFITSALSGVPWWHILIGVAAAITAVIVPALVSALIKLSRRDLSVILEGTRWAMNSPLRLTPRQGRFFTRKALRRRRSLDIQR